MAILSRRTVAISVKSPDPKELEAVGFLSKKGSHMVNCKLHTYVHVDSWEEFKQFLAIKFDETQRLWAKNLKLGSVLPEGEIAALRRSRRVRRQTSDAV
jgi:hypothetical protein